MTREGDLVPTAKVEHAHGDNAGHAAADSSDEPDGDQYHSWWRRFVVDRVHRQRGCRGDYQVFFSQSATGLAGSLLESPCWERPARPRPLSRLAVSRRVRPISSLLMPVLRSSLGNLSSPELFRPVEHRPDRNPLERQAAGGGGGGGGSTARVPPSVPVSLGRLTSVTLNTSVSLAWNDPSTVDNVGVIRITSSSSASGRPTAVANGPYTQAGSTNNSSTTYIHRHRAGDSDEPDELQLHREWHQGCSRKHFADTNGRWAPLPGPATAVAVAAVEASGGGGGYRRLSATHAPVNLIASNVTSVRRRSLVDSLDATTSRAGYEVFSSPHGSSNSFAAHRSDRPPGIGGGTSPYQFVQRFSGLTPNTARTTSTWLQSTRRTTFLRSRTR